MPSFTTTTTGAPTHVAKRPYAGSHSQSTITSYFPTTSSSTSSQTSLFQTNSAVRSDTSTLSPPTLPPLVQSNLLSVGMRVRKSVLEGYKTGLRKHNYLGGGGAGWRFLDSAPATPPTSFKTQVGSTATSRRELTPFCGIMKVGGMAVQGWDQDEEVPGEEDVPFLSSQGSTISTVSKVGEESWMSRTGTGHKRRFDEEEQDDVQIAGDCEVESEDPLFLDDIWRDDDVQLSPKTRPVDLVPSFGLGMGRRAMAVPRSRRKGRGAGGEEGGLKVAAMEGQENNNPGVLDIDFGEAEFMNWSAYA
jgi:hypothetical protein